jgi:hypothetical protein
MTPLPVEVCCCRTRKKSTNISIPCTATCPEKSYHVEPFSLLCFCFCFLAIFFSYEMLFFFFFFFFAPLFPLLVHSHDRHLSTLVQKVSACIFSNFSSRVPTFFAMRLGYFILKPRSFFSFFYYFSLSHHLSIIVVPCFSIMEGYQNVLASWHGFYWQYLSLSMPATTVCRANKIVFPLT